MVQEWIASWYLVIKALHLIAMTCWMVGLLYLPRLYVYHSSADSSSAESETFKVMEVRLLRLIMTPAMAVTFFLGGILLITPGAVDWSERWLWVKMVLVAGLTAIHIFLARCRREFANGENFRSGRFFRILNEVPTVLFVGVILLAVVKPF